MEEKMNFERKQTRAGRVAVPVLNCLVLGLNALFYFLFWGKVLSDLFDATSVFAKLLAFVVTGTGVLLLLFLLITPRILFLVKREAKTLGKAELALWIAALAGNALWLIFLMIPVIDLTISFFGSLGGAS